MTQPQEPPPPIGSLADEIVFSLRDRDGDAHLAAPEFESGRGVLQKLHDPDMFERYDTDADEQISVQEWRQGRQADRSSGNPQ